MVSGLQLVWPTLTFWLLEEGLVWYTMYRIARCENAGDPSADQPVGTSMVSPVSVSMTMVKSLKSELAMVT